MQQKITVWDLKVAESELNLRRPLDDLALLCIELVQTEIRRRSRAGRPKSDSSGFKRGRGPGQKGEYGNNSSY